MSASGGTPRETVKADQRNGEAFSMPQWLPHEAALLYTARSSADWTQARIVAQPSDGGAPRTLVTGAADARYVTTGHLLYVKLGTLVAVPFDPARLQITGAPVALLDDVMQAVNASGSFGETGAGQFAVAPAGTLAYVTGGIFPDRNARLVWMDRRGVETPLKQPPERFLSPRLSPDGQRLTYAIRKSGSRETDIWVYDLTRDVATPLTFVGDAIWPMWAPDGRHILFFGSGAGGSRGADLHWISPDGGGPPERVMAVPSSFRLLPSSASSTGLLALVKSAISEGRYEVWMLPLSGDRKPTLVVAGPFNVAWPAFSSDGRWLAYGSDESGRNEVYVQAYPGPGDKHRISHDGGTSPVWARNGRELFYKVRGSPDTTMMAVDVDTSSRFQSGEPRVLFSGRLETGEPIGDYDVSADGQRFIMMKLEPSPVNPVTSVHIVLNWTEELKQRVPLTK